MSGDDADDLLPVGLEQTTDVCDRALARAGTHIRVALPVMNLSLGTMNGLTGTMPVPLLLVNGHLLLGPLDADLTRRAFRLSNMLDDGLRQLQESCSARRI